MDFKQLLSVNALQVCSLFNLLTVLSSMNSINCSDRKPLIERSVSMHLGNLEKNLETDRRFENTPKQRYSRQSKNRKCNSRQ